MLFPAGLTPVRELAWRHYLAQGSLRNRNTAIRILKVSAEPPSEGPQARKKGLITGIRRNTRPLGYSSPLSLVRALEGVGYCLMIDPNPELERKVDAIVSTIEEIYESERFYAFPEAAVAYYLATGKDRWMKVSEKDSIYNKRQFFNAAGKPLQEPPASIINW